GENMASLIPLYRSNKKAFQARYEHGAKRSDSRDPWYGSECIVPEEYAQALGRAFVRQGLRPRDKTRAIGFKESRYGGVEFPKKEETLDYLWFLRNNFPNARFVFNERNIDDTARSAWWKDNKDAKKTIGNLAE